MALSDKEVEELKGSLLDWTNISFNDQALKDIVTAQVEYEITEFGVGDTATGDIILDSVATVLLGRAWPLNGERMTSEQRDEFYANLKTAAQDRGWLEDGDTEQNLSGKGVQDEVFVQTNYVVSALPPDHLESKHFTVFVECQKDGQYIVKDGYNFLVTKEGKYDNSGLIGKDSDYYSEHCLMSEQEALRVAKNYVAKDMLLGGLSVEDIKECDAMAAAGVSNKEINEFRRSIMQSPTTKEKMKLIFVTPQDVGWKVGGE